MPFKRRPQVKIYTSTGSMMCDLTKAYFRQADVDFDEINASPDTDGAKILLEESGDDKTPTVDFDGRLIVGYQPDVYAILLKENDAKNEAKNS